MSDSNEALTSARRRVLSSIAGLTLFIAVLAYILISQFAILDIPAAMILIGMASLGIFLLSKKLRQMALILEGHLPDFTAENAARKAREARRKRAQQPGLRDEDQR